MHFIGCDISKLTLDLAGANPAHPQKYLTYKKPNARGGWQQICRWIDQCWQAPRDEVCLVMEATGVYHQLAAHYFYAAGFRVIVCNPGRAADYSRSQNRLNKSDSLDARSLQCYGARLEKASYQPAGKAVRAVLSRQLRNLKRERDPTQGAIDDVIRGSESLDRDRQLMCSIIGVGPKTSQILLPLVHGARFDSARQLAAYVGLTPCHQRSGTSLDTPGRLSGRGDARVREALYMPALTAMRRNPELKAFYETLVSRGKAPKQAITAVMRKLVHLCFGVVKNQTPYRANYGCLP